MNAGKPKLVVVGNSMAGARVVEEILKRAPDRFDIVMFGAEPYATVTTSVLFTAGARTRRKGARLIVTTP